MNHQYQDQHQLECHQARLEQQQQQHHRMKKVHQFLLQGLLQQLKREFLMQKLQNQHSPYEQYLLRQMDRLKAVAFQETVICYQCQV